MKRRADWLLAAALLIASSCGAGGAGNVGNAGAGAGAEARAGEIACQRRLVEFSSRPGPRPAGLAGGFARMSEGFARMPLDGCSEAQRMVALAFARSTRALAATAARVGDVSLRGLERRRDLRTSEDFLELQSQIEGFERRRQALREDLGRMTRNGQ